MATARLLTKSVNRGVDLTDWNHHLARMSSSVTQVRSITQYIGQVKKERDRLMERVQRAIDCAVAAAEKEQHRRFRETMTERKRKARKRPTKLGQEFLGT